MKSLFVFFVLMSFMFSCNQTKFEYKTIESGIEFSVNNIKKRILFYGDEIARISVVKEGAEFKDSSLVVIDGADDVIVQIEDQEDLVLKTSLLKLKINKETGTIVFIDTSGKQLLEEHRTMRPVLEDTLILNSSYYKIAQSFKLAEKEGIYGLGQFQHGYMNYRGKDMLLVQSNRISVVPVLVSTNNYGILWDNYSRTSFHEGEDGMSFLSEVADQIDYYFVRGDNIDGVISGYRKLTGAAPMFAKKAYGFWQSKERYQSFDELNDVVDKYRKNKLPLDNIVQDWRYWGENRNWTSMYFEPENFPNPKKNIKKLHDKNVDFMVSIWPAIGSKTRIYKDMESKGYLLSPEFWAGGKVYDAYNKDARDLYWSYIEDGLANNGLDAYWMDGTEPEFSDTESQENTENALLSAQLTSIGPSAKYLNTFSLVTTEGVYKKHRSYTKDKRVFILTRSAFAGQQRNAAVTWSGDISASYDTFQKQISAGINFCMTGIPYWSHDIGAFYPSGRGGVYPFGIEDPAYQELYVRWFQFGAFTPIFRSHGTGAPREVWQFKERNPEYYEALRKTLNLRYQLLPYIYSNAWQITNNDYTLMRGLVMDFSNDEKTWNIDDQYMFGTSFMVKPVTKEMYHRAKQFPPAVEGMNLKTDTGEQGLKMTFFKDRELNEVGFTGVDEKIDYNWAGGGLPPGIPENDFSIRWEGKLVASESGKHKLILEADDGVRAWLSGEMIIDGWVEQGATPYEHIVDLNAGEENDLIIEYFQAGGGAQIRFVWETPSYVKERAKKASSSLDKNDHIYLPENNGWYNFWNNQYYSGGQVVTQSYSIDIFPLFVKAGSIIPLGPVQQYVGEQPDAIIEIRIYGGANAKFVYYEDEGNNYNYETGAYNEIVFTWNEENQTLQIGESKGDFEGFKKKKKFKITLINQDVETTKKSKDIDYSGDSLNVTFE